MKAIIIDDERSARNILQRLLTRVQLEVEVVAMCEDLPSGVEAIKKLNPDVVFLDVQMPEYAGYEIGDFISNITFEIVFITAHDQFAIKAFELSAVDYLLKPFTLERLENSLKRVQLRIDQSNSLTELNAVKNNLQALHAKQISVRHNGDNHLIDLSSIVAMQAQDSYTRIILADDEEFLSSKHLKYYERFTEMDDVFFRPHKSWVINLNCIKSYSKSNMTIQLKNGLEVKLSRHKMAQFEALLPRK